MSALARPPAAAPATRDTARAAVLTEAAGLTALAGALDGPLGEALTRLVDLVIAENRRVVITGMGKSGLIGRKIAATLSSTGTRAYFVHPAEASHGDLGLIDPQDVVLAMSWSGETKELSDVTLYCRRFGITLAAITSNAESTLARLADILLLLPKSPEACPNGLAPTTSTTMQLALGDAFAVALLDRRGFTATDFRVFHPGGKLGAQIRPVRELMHTGADLPLVASGTALADAIIEMTSKRFGTTGVVDAGGRLIGIVTDGDLRRAMAANRLTSTVDEVMTTRPKVAAPDMTAAEALAIMNRLSITVLFVVDGEQAVGIVHVHDFLRSGVM